MFALIARTLSGIRLKLFKPWVSPMITMTYFVQVSQFQFPIYANNCVLITLSLCKPLILRFLKLNFHLWLSMSSPAIQKSVLQHPSWKKGRTSLKIHNKTEAWNELLSKMWYWLKLTACIKTRSSCRHCQFSSGFCFKTTLELISGAIHENWCLSLM